MAYPETLPPSTRVDDVDDVIASDHNLNTTAIAAIHTELGSSPKGTFTSVEARLDDVDTNITHPSRIVEWTSQGTFGLITDVNSWYPLENVTLAKWQISAPSSGFPTAGTVVAILRKNGADISTITWDLSVGKTASVVLSTSVLAGDEIVPFIQSVGGLGSGESLENVVIHLLYDKA